jgi:hypothetical protein
MERVIARVNCRLAVGIDRYHDSFLVRAVSSREGRLDASLANPVA